MNIPSGWFVDCMACRSQIFFEVFAIETRLFCSFGIKTNARGTCADYFGGPCIRVTERSK